MTKITQTVLAALVFATAAVATASAKPTKPEAPTQSEFSWMDRASQNVDGGGY